MEKSTEKSLSVHLCGYGFEDPHLLKGKLHFHPFHQLNLVCGGWAHLITSGAKYLLKPGDAVLIFPGTHHLLQLEKDCGFCDYSFKFFAARELACASENIVITEPEIRAQQLVWINALGDIFKSIAPPELIRRPIEFPLNSCTPGIELLEELLYGFCRRMCGKNNSQNSWLLRKIKLLVQDRKGRPVKVSECAGHLNCSTGHLLNMVRRETGLSTKEIIDRERIAIAEKMLTCSNVSISRLAENLGFKDLIYFDRFFRKYTGESPGSYRKRTQDLQHSSNMI